MFIYRLLHLLLELAILLAPGLAIAAMIKSHHDTRRLDRELAEVQEKVLDLEAYLRKVRAESGTNRAYRWPARQKALVPR
jgi:hypothetical protein